MDETQIYKKLTDIFLEVLDLDSVELKADTVGDDIEGWDSLAHVRLMVATEQEFGIQFDTAEISELINVGELVSLISHKL